MTAIRVESSCFHAPQTPYVVELCLGYCKTDFNLTYSLFHATLLFPAVKKSLRQESSSINGILYLSSEF